MTKDFKLLDEVVVICDGYRKGRIGFIHTIKCNHDGGCHDGCVYYVRFHDIHRLVPYNAHELKIWISPEKVIFT